MSNVADPIGEQRWLRNYVTSVGWPLNTACLLAFVTVILHDFIFFGWLELFPRGAQLWKLLYDVEAIPACSAGYWHP